MSMAVKAAVTLVRHTLKEGDRCAVFSVRDTPRREVAITADRASVEKALTSIKASGRTSLYDAIASATRELRGEKVRKAIVILSDGGDTSSVMSFEDLDRQSKEAGIPLYFIAFDSGSPREPPESDRIKHLSCETGGIPLT